MVDLQAIPPAPTSQPIANRNGFVTNVWYNFFNALFQRTGGAGGSLSTAFDQQFGDIQGSMLARFAGAWEAFFSSDPDRVLVLGPGVDPALLSISELLDLIGTAHGEVLFRGAAGWEVLPPVAGGFFQSQGAGADPSYVLATTTATVATGLTAAGTTQADALQLTAQWSEITTTAAGTGVLVTPVGIGLDNRIWNMGANSLNVYPPVGSQIDGLGANNPYVLATTKAQVFSQLTATQWRSLQLG